MLWYCTCIIPDSQQTSADKEFGKLSADGSRAFEDLTLTRLAIYDGRIADAKKYVNEAGAAFDKARADETVFTKAQADLKTPTSKDTSANKNLSGAAPVDNVDGEKIPGAPNGMLNEMADQKKADRLAADRWSDHNQRGLYC
jgi:hypothetical protein